MIHQFGISRWAELRHHFTTETRRHGEALDKREGSPLGFFVLLVNWIIHKSWMMRPGFRLFLKNSVLKPEIQNTLLHKSKIGFWANL